MANILIFASGGGSNAEKIIAHLHTNTDHKVVAILSNRKEAGVYSIAKKYDVPSRHVSKVEIENDLPKLCLSYEAQLIVLAGFLKKIPAALVETYPNKIINIHPALLPKYGGKGMYGMNVHKAVFEAKEDYSGMTIHYVNNNYDEGGIIFQDNVYIANCQDAKEIAKAVLRLEHFHYPRIVHKLADSLLS